MGAGLWERSGDGMSQQFRIFGFALLFCAFATGRWVDAAPNVAHDVHPFRAAQVGWARKRHT